MPAFGNIVIKKSDGTTDVTYTGVTASSGDKTPAVWLCRSVGTTPAEQPRLTVTAEPTGTGTARRVRGTYTWPKVQTDAGGNKVVRGGTQGAFSLTVPQDFVSADIKEQAYQFGNLLASALIKASLEEGYAPR